MKEITYNELRELPENSYELIDIRDDGLIAYGTIPGAIHIFIEDLENSRILKEISKDKKLIFYCEVGRRSKEIDDTAEYLKDRDCYSLEQGYVGYIRSNMDSEDKKAEKQKKAAEKKRNLLVF